MNKYGEVCGTIEVLIYLGGIMYKMLDTWINYLEKDKLIHNGNTAACV